MIKSDAVYRIMSIPPGSSSSQFTYTNTAAATNAAASSYFPTPFHLQHSAAAAVTTPSQYPAPYVGPTPPPVVYPAAPAAAPVYSLPQYHQVYIYRLYVFMYLYVTWVLVNWFSFGVRLSLNLVFWVNFYVGFEN